MAHPSLWLVACGIALLSVAAPHASCHPTLDDTPHQMASYFRQTQEPEHYFPSYDIIERGDDLSIFEQNVILVAQQVVLTGCNILAALYVAYTFFVPFFFQGPAHVKPPNGPILQRSLIRGRTFDSLDFFDDHNALEMPAEEHCREQMICEMRYLVTFVKPLDNIIRTYGMRVPGLRQGYQKALDDGSSRRPCKASQKEECPNSVLTLLLSMAKAITGDHYY